ncbi:thioredoxin family protein [Tenacibaculum sp. FZY0031]|uniref:thioredoxin family protein n=1 Tax=Tenacibaculum sp. FZY0031 TaxID=3116648 RepID=UPI002EAC5451|nr:thioredoxin family protein [Tenacibaculum sp. FZY0031]
MKTFKIILMLLVVASISAFTSNNSGGYKVGDVAADFALKNINGKMVSLADYKEAKGFIVVFTCNMCPYSVANEDRLIALDNKYKKKGFPVIAINPNDPEVSKGDSYEAMKVRAKEKGFTFPYLFDEGQKVYPMYGATKTPHVYVLNKENNKLIVEYIGAIDDSSRNEANVKERFVENAVDALLKGEKPTKTDTRAIGCSIKDKRSW